MTTIVADLARATAVARYHVRFADEDLLLADLIRRLRGIEDLLYLASLPREYPTLVDMVEAGEIPRLYRTVRHLDGLLNSGELSPQLISVSLHSPLDVRFKVVAGAGVAAVAAGRVLGMYEQWQDIRIKRAAADLAELNVAREMISRTCVIPLPERSQNGDVPSDVGRQMSRRLDGAADVLTRIDLLEQEPDAV